MSVSIVQGPNVDLGAAMNGGQEFIDRLKRLRDAKMAAEEAINALALGKSARDANDEAGRVLAEAKAKRDEDMAALAADIQKAQDSLTTWSHETKAAAQQAFQEASDALSSAKVQKELAGIANAAAQKNLNKVNVQVAQMMMDSKAKAEAMVAEAQATADALMSKATSMHQEVSDALEQAKASKDKYDGLVAQLQAVLSKSA